MRRDAGGAGAGGGVYVCTCVFACLLLCPPYLATTRGAQLSHPVEGFGQVVAVVEAGGFTRKAYAIEESTQRQLHSSEPLSSSLSALPAPPAPPASPAPCSLLPAPCSLLPAPCSLLPAPCSLLPTPCPLPPSPSPHRCGIVY
jgi:hypothetical protein